MIGVVDYGVGNLFSLNASLRFLGAETVTTADTKLLDKCDKLILPGVGAFGDAIDILNKTGLAGYVVENAKAGKPLLGICLGMQLLFSESYEYGIHKGLDLIEGAVMPLSDKVTDLKIPQMGWNELVINKPCPLLTPEIENEFFYYVHSYYADGEKDYCYAYSDYGVKVAGVVGKDNVFGTQFHPEKSGKAGLKLLANFLQSEDI